MGELEVPGPPHGQELEVEGQVVPDRGRGPHQEQSERREQEEPAVGECGDSTQMTLLESRLVQSLFLCCLCCSLPAFSCSTSGENITERRNVNNCSKHSFSRRLIGKF